MTTQNDDPIISLYRDSFPDFARMVRRMGGGLEQARDNFHDALLIYLEKEKAGSLHLHTSPKAYLLGIARICWLRSQNSNLPLPEGFEAADTPDFGAADPSDAEETQQALLASLQKSGRKCLELLKAFYYDHCSMHDIAEKFGFKGRRSATVQKYKCLEKVREEIKTSLCAVN
jgi:DNA-directed RNA polymerase specialized sigma24 family protein